MGAYLYARLEPSRFQVRGSHPSLPRGKRCHPPSLGGSRYTIQLNSLQGTHARRRASPYACRGRGDARDLSAVTAREGIHELPNYNSDGGVHSRTRSDAFLFAALGIDI